MKKEIQIQDNFLHSCSSLELSKKKKKCCKAFKKKQKYCKKCPKIGCTNFSTTSTD